MSDEVMRIQNNVIQQAGQIATKLRLNKSMGQLYATLYLSEKAMSLEDMAKTCHMSKGNASINIRHLERWNAVVKVPHNNERKDYYEVNNNIMDFTMERVKDVFVDILKRGETVISETERKLENIDKNEMDESNLVKIEFYGEKLSKMKEKISSLKGVADKIGLIKEIIS